MMDSRLTPKVSGTNSDSHLTFESSSSHFHSKTYDNPRGEIRARLLNEWLSDWLERNPQCDQIIDIGCGDGRLALQLIANNPRLKAVLSDPSEAMKSAAQASVDALGLSSRVNVADISLERIRELLIPQNAIILCHGVVNWVSNPEFCVRELAQSCEKSGAALSLLFGNKIGHLLSFARAGEWEKCASLVTDPSARIPSELSREGLRLFEPREILDWLNASKEKQCRVRGLRCLSDSLPDIELKERFDEILGIEKMCAEDQRYLPIANMVHILLTA